MPQLMETLKKFSEGKTGKAVIIILLILSLVAVVFIVKAFITPSVTQPPKVTIENNQRVTTPTVSTETTSPSDSYQSEASIESGFEVFSTEILKDPFEPLAGTTETTQATQTVEKEKYTLTLVGIGYEEGVFKADVVYNNEPGTVAVGESIGPYLLVEVGSKSAKFLYGDMPVTLHIGETYNS